VLLAELEVFHTKPIQPTRRLAHGNLALPVEPAPGFGGVLLGGVVAAHIEAIDADLLPDLHRLINEVDRGQRIVQPRLRHRYQVDRHGLASSVHRLVGTGETVSFEFAKTGTPLVQILGAVYAAERIAPAAREALTTVLHQAMRWRGPIGPAFISHVTGVSGVRAESVAALVDPTAWALDVLGFAPGTLRPGRNEVRAMFRTRLRSVHPDHGGDEREAAKRIRDLSEARGILSR
jgi:hypothetical protein